MGDEGRDLRSVEEQEWSTTELRNSLRSIEWDLEVRILSKVAYCHDLAISFDLMLHKCSNGRAY